MVKVTVGDKELYLDGYLKQNLDVAKKVIKKDWDMIFIVDGAERGGKSNLAQQAAYYCDPSLTLDRIVFTPKQFEEAVLNAKPGQAIIWDEAVTGADAGQTITNIWKVLKKMMVQMGQKNLFVFIVIHSFFDLTKYLALWRTRALIHVYHDKFERGYFQFYNEERKKYLYVKGKKFYEYRLGRPNFIGRFKKGYCVSEYDYRQKKEDSLREDEDVKEKKDSRHIDHFAACLHLLKLKGMSNVEIHNELKKIVPNVFDLRTIQLHTKRLGETKRQIYSYNLNEEDESCGVCQG